VKTPSSRVGSSLVVASVVAVVAASTGCESTIVRAEEKHEISAKSDQSFLDGRIERLEKRTRDYPKRDDFQYEIAGIYFLKEDYRGAARHLMHAIDLRPDNPRYHYHLGRVYLKMREVGLAEASFRAALAHTPEGRYSGFHCALGLVKSMQSDNAGASQEFAAAIAAEPANPEPYYFYAAVRDLQGDRDEAVRYFREYLARGGRIFRSNAIFFLEKLGVVVDRAALERAERAVEPGADPFAG